MLKSLCVVLLVGMTTIGVAQRDPNLKIETQFERYSVRHVVFNSTFVLPEVARIHGIKRSKYESLLNVSLTGRDAVGSIPARVTGTVSNLMQQQKDLVFKEIREKNATYYLAPVRVANEEVLHFRLRVTPEGMTAGKTLEVNFSQTVYADE